MENIILESRSSFDRITKLNMLFVFTLVFLIALIFLYIFYRFGQNAVIGLYSTLILYGVLMMFGYFNTPVKYYLTNSKLYIKRPGGLIRINLRDIKEIRGFRSSDRQGLINIFGSVGLFGNFGIYSSKKHKRFNLYATRKSNWVLIEMNFGKKYVISPDDLRLVEKTNELLQRQAS